VFVCVCVCVCVCICVYVCVCVCVFMHYIYLDISMYTYTHIYTHTCAQMYHMYKYTWVPQVVRSRVTRLIQKVLWKNGTQQLALI
jgi:hypothetical protein